MKLTRRAALLGMAGSGGVLAVDTLGFTRVDARRSVNADVVSDPEAYLGLTEDGLSELLFDGGPYPSPKPFTVANQLTETVSVELDASGTFRFVSVEDGCSCGGDDPISIDQLAPGEHLQVAGALVEPTEAATADVEIVADAVDGDTRIRAERELSLKPSHLIVLRFKLVPLVLTVRTCPESRGLLLEVVNTRTGKTLVCKRLPWSYKRKKKSILLSIVLKKVGFIGSLGGSTSSASDTVAPASGSVEVEEATPDVSATIESDSSGGSGRSRAGGVGASSNRSADESLDVRVDFGDGSGTPDTVVPIEIPIEE